MKKVVKHESREQFFERMHELAQKIDRGESVPACENISFEDVGEMDAYLSSTMGQTDSKPISENIHKLPTDI